LDSVPVLDGWVKDPVGLRLLLLVVEAVDVRVAPRVGVRLEVHLNVVLGEGDELLDRVPVWEVIGGRV